MHKQTLVNWLPGILLAFIIAGVANFITNIFPMPILSASVIALFLGIGLNHFFNDQVRTRVASGVNFVSRRVLKFAIILLGASLNVTTIMSTGQLSVPIMIFTFLTCFGAGYFIGKAFGINWKMSNLISAGMAICGGLRLPQLLR